MSLLQESVPLDITADPDRFLLPSDELRLEEPIKDSAGTRENTDDEDDDPTIK